MLFILMCELSLGRRVDIILYDEILILRAGSNQVDILYLRESGRLDDRALSASALSNNELLSENNNNAPYFTKGLICLFLFNITFSKTIRIDYVYCLLYHVEIV